MIILGKICQFDTESIFFSAFGFAAMIYLHKHRLSIVVVAIYSGTHILTHCADS